MTPHPSRNNGFKCQLGSYGRSAKQHLFLLGLLLATVAINGQPDGDSGLFVPGIVRVEVEGGGVGGILT